MERVPSKAGTLLGAVSLNAERRLLLHGSLGTLGTLRGILGAIINPGIEIARGWSNTDHLSGRGFTYRHVCIGAIHARFL
jgi:hypothetical protein